MEDFLFGIGLKTYVIYLGLVLVLFTAATAALKKPHHRLLSLAGYGLCAAGALLYLWSFALNRFNLSDFTKAYYPAGRLIIENPASLYEALPGYGLGFVNIPILAFLFSPFSFLQLFPALILFVALGCIAVVASYFWVTQRNPSSLASQLIVASLFILNSPLYYSIWLGNTTHFILLLLLIAVFLQKPQEFTLGVLFAIAALIKIPLALFGGYFLLRKAWSALAGFSVAIFMTVGLSIWLFGFDLHLTWFRECVQPFSGKALAAYNVQSVDSVLARWFTDGNIENWQPLALGFNFKIMRYAMLSLLVGGSIFSCWKGKPPKTLEERNLELSIVLCLSLLISPISWTHYYLLLLLPLSLYFTNRLAVPNELPWLLGTGIGSFLISLPIIPVTFGNPTLQLIWSKFIVSSPFWGGTLLLLVWALARASGAGSSQRLTAKLESL